MSDLISRQDAVTAISDLLLIQLQGKRLPTWNEVYHAIDDIPSAESERTAKVIEHDASVTDTDGYKYHRSEYLCCVCKKKVIGGDEYCSHCGAKLEWNHE